jgi:lantibiotic modifying enzyme
MYKVLHENKIFELAMKLGDELLSSSTQEKVGLSWNSKVNGVDSQHNLTGFSHGAAGIGYSLLELYLNTDRKKYREAAEQAFAYENNWFNSEYGNWPDFRIAHQLAGSNREEFTYATAWCHGAPGIGLARLRAFQILQEETQLNDSLVALRTAIRSINDMNSFSGSNFSLCHGLAGVCELLIYGASILKDDSYNSVASDVGKYGIDKYAKPGLTWPCGIQTGETPDLMLGLAGIGYFYLRLLDIQKVPSILIISSS